MLVILGCQKFELFCHFASAMLSNRRTTTRYFRNHRRRKEAESRIFLLHGQTKEEDAGQVPEDTKLLCEFVVIISMFLLHHEVNKSGYSFS